MGSVTEEGAGTGDSSVEAGASTTGAAVADAAGALQAGGEGHADEVEGISTKTPPGALVSSVSATGALVVGSAASSTGAVSTYPAVLLNVPTVLASQAELPAKPIRRLATSEE